MHKMQFTLIWEMDSLLILNINISMELSESLKPVNCAVEWMRKLHGPMDQKLES